MRYWVAFFLMVVVAGAEEPEVIPLAYDVERVWKSLPDASAPEGAVPGITHNVYPVSRALDRDTGEVLGPEEPEQSCDPQDIRRFFRVEKQTFLLGEPILVEYRVELDGPGFWTEGSGSNYRSRGRDDNFYFLMEREDGSLVEEVQPFLGGIGGGMGGWNRVTSEKPNSDWQAVQRWCAVAEPGRYTLHCLYRTRHGAFNGPVNAAAKALLPKTTLGFYTVDHSGRLIDPKTGENSSQHTLELDVRHRDSEVAPLLEKMPLSLQVLLDTEAPSFSTRLSKEETIARSVLLDRQHAIRGAHAYAQFPIEVRRGTKADQAGMVTQWTTLADPKSMEPHGQTRKRAALQAIHFSLSEAFVPAILAWHRADSADLQSMGLRHGLYLLDSPDVTALLLAEDHYLAQALLGEYRWGSPLTDAQRRAHVVNLIELLTSDNAKHAQQALQLLRAFAGGWFVGNAGAPADDLTASELRSAQGKWRTWLNQQPQSLPGYTGGIWGYINTSGTFVIAPQYTSAAAFFEGTAEVSRGGENYSISVTGERVAAGERRWGEGPYPVHRDGKWGYETADGALVIEPRFDGASPFLQGRATVRTEGTTVVIDKAGNVLFGSEYHIDRVCRDGSMVRSKIGATDMLYGLLDREGKEILPAEYAAIGEPAEGLVSVAVRDSNGALRYGFANLEGDIIIKPQFLSAHAFSEGVAAVESAETTSSNWGYIDRAGNWEVSPAFQHAGAFHGGMAEASTATQDAAYRYGFINAEGQWAIEPRYERTTRFSEGLAAVKVASPYRWLGYAEAVATQ